MFFVFYLLNFLVGQLKLLLECNILILGLVESLAEDILILPDRLIQTLHLFELLFEL